MPEFSQRNERIVALFVVGVLAFNPPLLRVFDAGPDVMLFGIPLLYLYLFLAWAALIVCVALLIERPKRGSGKQEAFASRETKIRRDSG